MGTEYVKSADIQSIRPGTRTLEAFHLATCSGTANTITTETITLDKTYAAIKPISLAIGGISTVAGGMAQGCFVSNVEDAVGGSTFKVNIRSSQASEAVGIRALFLVKEVGA